jgi:hypothetical protein
MRSMSCLLIVTSALFAACVDIEQSPDQPDAPTISTVERIGTNRIGTNRIGTNRIGTNRIAAARLAERRLSTRRLQTNMTAAGGLLSTEGGREVFSAIVSCALPDDTTLVAKVGTSEFEFTGEMNLAPQWLLLPLDPSGERWVSACIFAKVNARDVALPISFRGPHPELAVSPDESVTWAVEEGAFFGNMFGPLNQPIQWFACRGEGQAAGEFGGLVERDCTEPDPAQPGFTQCGFRFAGDCGAFDDDRFHRYDERGACESFSERGTFYRSCHTSPIQRFPRPGDREFSEVITIYVTP